MALPLSWDEVTYKTLTERYTPGEANARPMGVRDAGGGVTRHVPVKHIPKGCLLYTFMQHTPHEDPVINGYRLLANILRATCVESFWYDEGSRTFKFCTGVDHNRFKYFYPSPIAGFGVAGYADGFNIGIECVARKDVKVAYLKSGTDTPGDKTVNRRNQLAAIPDFSFRQVRLCHTGPTVPISCDTGKNHDVCLERRFGDVNNLGGVEAIARPDSIQRTAEGGYVQPNSMMGAMRAFYNQTVAEGTIGLYSLYNKIFLTLESNRFDGTTIGFPEICLTSSGDRAYKFGKAPPIDNIPFNAGRPLYTYLAEESSDRRKVYSIRTEQMAEFYRLYIQPSSVVDITRIITSRGVYTKDGVLNNPPLARDYDPTAVKDITRNFANALYRAENLYYSQRLNMFVLHNHEHSSDQRLLNMRLQYQPNSGIFPPDAPQIMDYTTGGFLDNPVTTDDDLTTAIVNKIAIFALNDLKPDQRNHLYSLTSIISANMPGITNLDFLRSCVMNGPFMNRLGDDSLQTLGAMFRRIERDHLDHQLSNYFHKLCINDNVRAEFRRWASQDDENTAFFHVGYIRAIPQGGRRKTFRKKNTRAVASRREMFRKKNIRVVASRRKTFRKKKGGRGLPINSVSIPEDNMINVQPTQKSTVSEEEEQPEPNQEIPNVTYLDEDSENILKNLIYESPFKVIFSTLLPVTMENLKLATQPVVS